MHGPYDPANGHRCNPGKLLLDPYAKAVDGDIDWDESLFSYRFKAPEKINTGDSAPHMSKSVVINPFFDWDNDRAPRTPYNESVVYEAHVRGLTKTHPKIPDELRGTYAAIGHPVMIEHFHKLGADPPRRHAAWTRAASDGEHVGTLAQQDCQPDALEQVEAAPQSPTLNSGKDAPGAAEALCALKCKSNFRPGGRLRWSGRGVGCRDEWRLLRTGPDLSAAGRIEARQAATAPPVCSYWAGSGGCCCTGGGARSSGHG